MLTPDPRPISRLWLILLLLFALALRLTWSVLAPADQASFDRLPDQGVYLDLARNLLARQGLVHVDTRFDAQVFADRMPLYPLFLAACRAHVPTIRIIQSLIDTSTVLAIYLLARRFLTMRPSLFAAALVAFNPFLVYFSALILTETIFTSMLAWSMFLLALPIPIVLPGLLLAASILVRPSAIALPVLLGFAAAFLNRSSTAHRPSRWPIPVGSTMLLLTGLLLFPWALRNRAVLGQWVWTTTNSGFVAFDGFNDSATGASDQSALSSLELNMRLRRSSETDRSKLLHDHARQWIAQTWRDNPQHLIKLTIAKIARTWSPIPLSQNFASRRNIIAALLFSIPFDLLIVLGLWKSAMPRVPKLVLILPALYFTCVHAVSVGSLRYRVPVEPILAVLAAAGAMAVLARVRLPAFRRSTPSHRTDGQDEFAR